MISHKLNKIDAHLSVNIFVLSFSESISVQGYGNTSFYVASTLNSIIVRRQRIRRFGSACTPHRPRSIYTAFTDDFTLVWLKDNGNRRSKWIA